MSGRRHDIPLAITPRHDLTVNENPGCEFIATNLDAVTHLTDAQEWAGNGAVFFFKTPVAIDCM